MKRMMVPLETWPWHLWKLTNLNLFYSFLFIYFLSEWFFLDASAKQEGFIENTLLQSKQIGSAQSKLKILNKVWIIINSSAIG